MHRVMEETEQLFIEVDPLCVVAPNELVRVSVDTQLVDVLDQILAIVPVCDGRAIGEDRSYREERVETIERVHPQRPVGIDVVDDDVAPA